MTTTRKTIMVPPDVHDRLDSCPLAKRGDTYAEIIEKLLDYYEERRITKPRP